MKSGGGVINYCKSCIAGLSAAVLLLCIPLTGRAGGELFLPNYLPNHIGPNRANLNDISTLSNEDLLSRAQSIRDNSLSTAQRALNYQWMSQLHQEEDVTEGGKVFSRLLQRSLKEYWNNKRIEHFGNSKLIPNAEGHGSINSFDYDVRLSSDTVRFGFSYDF